MFCNDGCVSAITLFSENEGYIQADHAGAWKNQHQNSKTVVVCFGSHLPDNHYRFAFHIFEWLYWTGVKISFLFASCLLPLKALNTLQSRAPGQLFWIIWSDSDLNRGKVRGISPAGWLKGLQLAAWLAGMGGDKRHRFSLVTYDYSKIEEPRRESNFNDG